MKRTLLDMTQSILSSLGSDEVNSISDTTESMQVADIIKTTYYNMVNRLDLPVQYELVELDPSLDILIPVIMYIPDNVGKIEWIKYFNTTTTPIAGYQYVTILPIDQFIDITNGFNPDQTDVSSFTYDGDFTFYYKNNKQPQYCTILKNTDVIFDGYDTAVDSTLQSSKSMVYGQILPTWTASDSFIPSLGDEQFPLLFNEAKSLAFFELKQSAHPKAEQEAKRGWSAVQKDKAVIENPSYFNALPDFGRRGATNSSYFKSRGWDRP